MKWFAVAISAAVLIAVWRLVGVTSVMIFAPFVLLLQVLLCGG